MACCHPSSETTVGDAHTTRAGDLLNRLGDQCTDALCHRQVAAEVPRRSTSGKGQYAGPADLEPRHDGGHGLGHATEGARIDEWFVSNEPHMRATSLGLASALPDAHTGSSSHDRTGDHPIGMHDGDRFVGRTARGDHRPLRAVHHRQARQRGTSADHQRSPGPAQVGHRGDRTDRGSDPASDWSRMS